MFAAVFYLMVQFVEFDLERVLYERSIFARGNVAGNEVLEMGGVSGSGGNVSATGEQKHRGNEDKEVGMPS